ncbi:hypothetical protein [Paraburkholderia rhynchosiae]|uniref:hypothetical protein n=1 Tax=Paraburkholderia rhynchosiae TaxID=487049 RepID=UPI001304DAAB
MKVVRAVARVEPELGTPARGGLPSTIATRRAQIHTPQNDTVLQGAGRAGFRSLLGAAP